MDLSKVEKMKTCRQVAKVRDLWEHSSYFSVILHELYYVGLDLIVI